MEWVELALPAGELAEEVAAILASTDEVAAAGVEVRDDLVVMWAHVEDADAAAQALRAAAVRLRDNGLPVTPESVRVRPAPPETEWRDSWKRYFHVTRLGKSIVIVPSWETHAPSAGDIILDLDPGRAFGTGAHASTRLCLVELERLRDEGATIARFLDVGTGSGILSVAAAKLWPSATGLAVDVDPQAVDAARENLDRNGVGARVATSDTDAADIPGQFDCVVANIQADVLVEIVGALLARTAPGGTIILSGILSPHATSVAEAYAAGASLVQRTASDDGDWTALVLRKT
jgi:ribosomal protein L11 methyltransferase